MTKFSSYDKILHYIKYHKLSGRPGALTQYLYTAFVTQTVRFCAETAKNHRVLPEGVHFCDFLRSLEKSNLISVKWDGYAYKSVSEGSYLHRMFNEERSYIARTLTEADLDPITKEIETLKEISIGMCRKFNIPYDPPDFKELRKALFDEVPF